MERGWRGVCLGPGKLLPPKPAECKIPLTQIFTRPSDFEQAARSRWSCTSSCISRELALLSSSAGSCSDCGFTGKFLSLPWYLFLIDVFYLDSRGVIVVAWWECAKGLASGLSPVSGSLARGSTVSVFYPSLKCNSCFFNR